MDSYHNILSLQGWDHISRRWRSVLHPARQRPPRPSVEKEQWLYYRVWSNTDIMQFIKLTLIFSIQSRIETALTHTRGSDLMLRAHCSHFFCSAWLMQHHRTTLSSSELPAHKFDDVTHNHTESVTLKLKVTVKHLHVRGLWAEPHNPAPAPDWRPCRLEGQIIYLWHLWRGDRSPRKQKSWRVGSAVSLSLDDQTASEE